MTTYPKLADYGYSVRIKNAKTPSKYPYVYVVVDAEHPDLGKIDEIWSSHKVPYRGRTEKSGRGAAEQQAARIVDHLKQGRYRDALKEGAFSTMCPRKARTQLGKVWRHKRMLADETPAERRARYAATRAKKEKEAARQKKRRAYLLARVRTVTGIQDIVDTGYRFCLNAKWNADGSYYSSVHPDWHDADVWHTSNGQHLKEGVILDKARETVERIEKRIASRQANA